MGTVEARLFVKEGARVVIGDILEAEGSQVEAEIAEALVDHPVVILKWHGPFAKGDSMAQAYHNIQAMETAARFYMDIWRMRNVIGEPDYVPWVGPPEWSEKK